MKEYCCDVMEGFATRKNKLVDYVPEHRSYTFYLLGDQHGTRQQMFYCFWCGEKLPEELGEEWDKILKEEYGIKDAAFSWNYDKIPPEFKTDEWWKQRGL